MWKKQYYRDTKMASLTTVNTAPSPNRINSVENLSNNKRIEYKIYYETNDNGKKTLCGEFTFLYDNKIKNINVNKYIMDEIVNRNVLNGFTKDIVVNNERKIEIKMSWQVPKIIGTVTRVKQLLGEVEVCNDIENNILTIQNKNANLLKFGTFHELGTYTLMRNGCIKYHVIIKVTKPFVVPFSIIQYYGIKYLNFCWENRVSENRALLELLNNNKNGSNNDIAKKKKKKNIAGDGITVVAATKE